ncbi:hypothetical protein EV714DRAFT_221155 [Schizophyllum commune]
MRLSRDQNLHVYVSRAEEGAGGSELDSELPRVVPSSKGPTAKATTSTPPAGYLSHAGAATVKPSAIPPQVCDWDGTAPTASARARHTDYGEVAHLRLALEAARKESDERYAALLDAEQRYAHRVRQLESDARTQNKRLLTMAATERGRAARAEADHKNTCKLLEARTAELASAQAFLGSTDELSERDVASRMETLNEEIFQLSALLADSVQLGPADNSTASALEVVRSTLGEYMCSKLTGGEDDERLVSGEDDARLGLLQVALQAAATHWCQVRIERWTYNGSADRYAKHLHKIVRQRRKSSGACVTDRLIPSLERPDVAKRWRIITQKSLPTSDGDDETKLLSSLHNALNVVTMAAACVAKNVKGDADLQQAFQEGSQAIVRLTLQLRRDMSIGITSTQLNTIHPRPNQPYHSATMEAEDANQQRKSSTVGCGISLGLVRDHGTPQRHTLIKSNVFIAHE